MSNRKSEKNSPNKSEKSWKLTRCWVGFRRMHWVWLIIFFTAMTLVFQFDIFLVSSSKRPRDSQQLWSNLMTPSSPKRLKTENSPPELPLPLSDPLPLLPQKRSQPLPLLRKSKLSESFVWFNYCVHSHPCVCVCVYVMIYTHPPPSSSHTPRGPHCYKQTAVHRTSHITRMGLIHRFV
jgi:hypothetical protein